MWLSGEIIRRTVKTMAAILENAYFRHRLRQMDHLYPEPSAFGQCDCTSYSYFALSLVLFAVGTVITVLALGDAHGYIFFSLGHMWLVGPIFICSGLMVAVKSVLYLRKKNLIQMLLRQRALLRVSVVLISVFLKMMLFYSMCCRLRVFVC